MQRTRIFQHKSRMKVNTPQPSVCFGMAHIYFTTLDPIGYTPMCPPSITHSRTRALGLFAHMITIGLRTHMLPQKRAYPVPPVHRTCTMYIHIGIHASPTAPVTNHRAPPLHGARTRACALDTVGDPRCRALGAQRDVAQVVVWTTVRTDHRGRSHQILSN